MKSTVDYTHKHNYEHECRLCGIKIKNRKGLQLHLTKTHKFSKNGNKDYYDKFLKKDGEDVCKFSGDRTEYINFTQGYNNISFEVRKTAKLPNQINYWIMKHGKSKEEAKTLVSEIQSKRGNKTQKGDEARKNSVRCKEYWMERHNMNIDQAEFMIQQYQSNSGKSETNKHLKSITLKNMQRKYGKDEGQKKWDSYIEKKRKNSFVTAGNTSLIEITFCNMIELMGFRGRYGKNQRTLFDEEFGRLYRYDFSWRNAIVEFHGSYYHGNNGNDVIRGSKKVTEIKDRDIKKKDKALKSGYRYLEVHENTFRRAPMETLNKVVEFLKGNEHVDEI